MKQITNELNTIDSIDIIDKIEEIKETVKELKEELKSLTKITKQTQKHSKFKHSETLIREDYFTDYYQEVREDLGDIPEDLPSYIRCNIDWEEIANEAKIDYQHIDFDGVTYLKFCN